MMKKTKNILNLINFRTCFAVLPTMILVACSNGEVAEPMQEQQRPICFAGNMQKETAETRADKGLEEVLTNKTFKAWAYKNTAVSVNNYTDYQNVMLGYTVNYEMNSGSASNTHDWEYVGKGTNQTIKFWDFSAYAYRFFAYALGNGTPSPVTEDTSDDSQVSFTAAVNGFTETSVDAAPYFSELWFSNDKENDYGKAVTLRFLKPFARVRFIFKFVEGLDFGREALSHISFSPNPTTGNPTPTIPTAGNVTFTYPLKGTETKESWSSTITDGVNEFTEDNHWYYVMPIENQGTYSIHVAVVTEEIKTATVPVEYMSWKPGFEYTYVFRITEGGGVTIDVIQVAVNEWDDSKGSISHPVYNW